MSSFREKIVAVTKKIYQILRFPLFVGVALIVIPFLIIFGLCHLAKGTWLNYRFRQRWNSENRHILFVYSESPNWKPYIEEQIVPKIEGNATFLNWSKRSEWKKKKSLEGKVFSHWAGGADFNPMAIVFAPKGKVKTIRFYQAFKDYKHGKSTLLQEKESELFSYLKTNKIARDSGKVFEC